MSTKSQEVIWGGQIMGAEIRSGRPENPPDRQVTKNLPRRRPISGGTADAREKPAAELAKIKQARLAKAAE